MRYPFLFILAVYIAIANATELTFELADNEKQCFHEDLEQGAKFDIDFQVIVPTVAFNKSVIVFCNVDYLCFVFPIEKHCQQLKIFLISIIFFPYRLLLEETMMLTVLLQIH